MSIAVSMRNVDIVFGDPAATKAALAMLDEGRKHGAYAGS